MFFKRPIIVSFHIVLIALALVGCGARPGPTVSPAQTGGPNPGPSVTPTAAQVAATATPVPTPTLTPEPLALNVNGEGITIAEYQAELKQLQEAHKALNQAATADQERQQVLDNLTNTLLLAQGAVEAGYKADDQALQAEIDQLSQQLGSADALKQWMADRGYSEATFKAALKRNLAAAWQRDQITAKVPVEAEQIHARQILTTDEGIAQKALERVKQPGMNFAAYAYQYDPLTGGDLGWFPRGYLTQPEVEDAAFQLQPGQISGVVKSSIGYHIVQVISREPSRVISPDARRVLQHKALQDWLKARREGSKVEVLLP